MKGSVLSCEEKTTQPGFI